jgi:hypothetical protein
MICTSRVFMIVRANSSCECTELISYFQADWSHFFSLFFSFLVDFATCRMICRSTGQIRRTWPPSSGRKSTKHQKAVLLLASGIGQPRLSSRAAGLSLTAVKAWCLSFDDQGQEPIMEPTWETVRWNRLVEAEAFSWLSLTFLYMFLAFYLRPVTFLLQWNVSGDRDVASYVWGRLRTSSMNHSVTWPRANVRLESCRSRDSAEAAARRITPLVWIIPSLLWVMTPALHHRA